MITLNEQSVLQLEDWEQKDLGVRINSINKILKDRENNIWICTESGVYNFFNLNFEEIRINVSEKDNVTSVIQDNDGEMWFGIFDRGLWKMDKNHRITPMFTDIEGSNYQFWNISKSKGGSLFFPFMNGVIKYKKGTAPKATNTNGCIATYYDDEQETLYYMGVGPTAQYGIYKENLSGRRFYQWNKGPIIAMAKDIQGHIRVGSYDAKGILRGDSLIEDTLKSDYKSLYAMDIQKNGIAWLGTEKGLYARLVNGKEIKIAKEHINNLIVSVKDYRGKYILAGGIEGLYVVDVNDLEKNNQYVVYSYSYDNGFTGLEAGQNGFSVDDNGDVWMTSSLSVMRFNPEKLILSKRNKLPTLRLGSLYYSIDNLTWNKSFPADSVIRLKSYNKFLRFEYIANSISAPRSLRFKYRLKGFSNEWSQPVYTKTADFTNLSYGKYTFEVQCSLDGVKWSPVARSPVIHILTPFWMRWYMRALYILFFAFSIAASVYYLLKRNERKKLEALSRQKLENELQLRTLHSKVLPHFTKNVLTAIGHYAMDDNRKAGKYIAMFSKFTQLTLENSDKNYNTLEQELLYVENYMELEKMRFGDRFAYTIETENGIDRSVFIPAMALHTYCDNALRHGLVNKNGAGTLHVQIKKEKQGMVIAVTDNGIGRKRSSELGTQGNRMGLLLVQQQLDFYNKLNENKITQTITDLEDENGDTPGTQVELFIPDGYRFSS